PDAAIVGTAEAGGLEAFDLERASPMTAKPPLGNDDRWTERVIKACADVLHEDSGLVLDPRFASGAVDALFPQAAPVDAGDQTPARLEYPPHLEKPGRPIGEVTEDRRGVDEVERSVRFRKGWRGVIGVQVDGRRVVPLQPLDAGAVYVASDELRTAERPRHHPTQRSTRAASEVEHLPARPIDVGG